MTGEGLAQPGSREMPDVQALGTRQPPLPEPENRLKQMQKSIPVIREVAKLIGDIVKEQGCEAKMHFSGDCQNFKVDLNWDVRNAGLINALKAQISDIKLGYKP